MLTCSRLLCRYLITKVLEKLHSTQIYFTIIGQSGDVQYNPTLVAPRERQHSP